MRGRPLGRDHEVVSAPPSPPKTPFGNPDTVAGPRLHPILAPRLYRSSRHRVFGGVAGGLAEHLGLEDARSRWLIRAAFVGLAFASGVGVVLYGAYWFVLTNEQGGRQLRGRPLWVQYLAGGVAAAIVLAIVVADDDDRAVLRPDRVGVPGRGARVAAGLGDPARAVGAAVDELAALGGPRPGRRASGWSPVARWSSPAAPSRSPTAAPAWPSCGIRSVSCSSWHWASR